MKLVDRKTSVGNHSAASDEVLTTSDLVVQYGAAVALDGVSIRVSRGEMVALIGPNGAGKTTLLNTLSGVIRPRFGSIALNGRLAHVPEGRQVFPDLTVDDNLKLGAFRHGSRDPSPMYEIFPQLARLRFHRAGTLSGGEQQMVALCRALMADPDLIAVDELSQGLAPLVVSEIARHLVELNRRHGTAVLLVEQNAQLALDITQRAYVLETGLIRTEGPSSELAQNPAVRRAYLGGV